MQRRCITLSIAIASLLILVRTCTAQPGRNPRENEKPYTMIQVWAMDAVYRDLRHGVTFLYPSIWKDAPHHFSYEDSAIGRSAIKPVAGFGYVEGGFPRKPVVGPYSSTNLETIGVFYTAVDSTEKKQCERIASQLANVAGRKETIRLGDRFFWVYEVGETYMHSSFSGHLYVTFADRTCYLFETDVAALNVTSIEDEDDIAALTTDQNRSINAHLFDIVKSVRIIPQSRQGGSF
jgi:hypothetical protein